VERQFRAQIESNPMAKWNKKALRIEIRPHKNCHQGYNLILYFYTGFRKNPVLDTGC
jgi:hypothetical protein